MNLIFQKIYVSIRRLLRRLPNHLKWLLRTGFFPYANECFIAQSENLSGQRDKVITLVSCYNQWDYTKKTIESYYSSLDDKRDYYLVLLDDCSTNFDGKFVLKEMSHYRNFSYIRFKKNKGLTRSWNYGVNYAIRKLKADYVVIANDDIIIPAGTIGRLVDALQAVGCAAIIGPLTNCAGMHSATQDIGKYLSDYVASDKMGDIERTSRAVSSNRISEVSEINGFFWAGHAEAFSKNVFSRILSLRFYFNPARLNFDSELEFQTRVKSARPPVKILLAANTFVFHYKDVSQKRWCSKSIYERGGVHGREMRHDPIAASSEKRVLIDTSYSFCYNHAPQNYFHFLIGHLFQTYLVLSKARLLDGRFGLNFVSGDGPYPSRPTDSFSRRFYPILFNIGKTINLDREFDLCLKMDGRIRELSFCEYITTTKPDLMASLNKYTASGDEPLLKSFFYYAAQHLKLNTSVLKPSVVFVRRAMGRDVVNCNVIRNEIKNVCRRRKVSFFDVDFEFMNPLGQIRLMNQTKILVGYHGSGLTNQIFMPPGGVVIEIMPENFACSAYLKIARFMKHRSEQIGQDPDSLSLQIRSDYGKYRDKSRTVTPKEIDHIVQIVDSSL